MGSILFDGLVVPGMADVAKIAKRMRLMPASAVVVDRHLSLHLMAVLA
jgi:hypothetical protein